MQGPQEISLPSKAQICESFLNQVSSWEVEVCIGHFVSHSKDPSLSWAEFTKVVQHINDFDCSQLDGFSAKVVVLEGLDGE